MSRLRPLVSLRALIRRVFSRNAIANDRKGAARKLGLERLEERLVMNAAPIAVDDHFSVLHDQTLYSASSLLDNDFDPDNDPIAIVNYTQPANGSVTVNGDGSITYIPNPRFKGLDSFQYTLGDGIDTTVASVTIDVTNQAPSAVNDAFSVVHAQAHYDNVLVNDVDADGDPLTVSEYTQPSHGSLIMHPDGSYAYIAAANYEGADSFTYTLTDGADSATATVYITITNAAPQLNSPGSLHASEDELVFLTLSAIDDDGDNLTFAITGLPDGLSSDATGNIWGTPTFLAAGTYSVSVALSDGITTTYAGFNWIIANTNRTPSFINPGPLTNNETDYRSFSIAPSDPDGDSYTVAFTGMPDGMSGDPWGNVSGWLTYTAAGEYIVTATVTDIHGGSFTDTFPWTVANTNRPPTFNSPGVLYNYENDVVHVPLSADDPDGENRTFSVTGLPDGLTADEAGVITGTLSYTSAGWYTVNVTVSDGIDSTTGVFYWSVSNTNRAPNLTNPGPQSSAEADTIHLPLAAIDDDGDPVSFTFVGLPDGLIADSTGNITGTLSYNAAGSYTIGVWLSDGQTTMYDSFTWDVANTNRAPNITYPGDQNSAEGDEINLVIAASDPDGDPITSITITGLPDGLTADNAGNITGWLSYDSAGTYTIDIEATDGSESTYGSFFWTVAHVNFSPLVFSDYYAIERNSPFQATADIGLMANDYDDDGDAFFIQACGDDYLTVGPETLFTTAQGGHVNVHADGGFEYAPPADFVGEDWFRYAIADSHGNVSDFGYVVFQVAAVPIAQDNDYKGSVLAHVVGNILVDDTGDGVDEDPGGEELLVSTVNGQLIGEQQALRLTGGMLTISSLGEVVYTPDANFSGLDSFTYTITNGIWESAPATVRFEIGPSPFAYRDTYAVLMGDSLDTTANGVSALANDVAHDVAAGDSLWVTLLSPTAHGTLTLATDGHFLYTPEEDFTGIDDFSYAFFNGYGWSNAATVWIEVHGEGGPIGIDLSNSPETMPRPIASAHLDRQDEILESWSPDAWRTWFHSQFDNHAALRAVPGEEVQDSLAPDELAALPAWLQSEPPSSYGPDYDDSVADDPDFSPFLSGNDPTPLAAYSTAEFEQMFSGSSAEKQRFRDAFLLGTYPAADAAFTTLLAAQPLETQTFVYVGPAGLEYVRLFVENTPQFLDTYRNVLNFPVVDAHLSNLVALAARGRPAEIEAAKRVLRQNTFFFRSEITPNPALHNLFQLIGTPETPPPIVVDPVPTRRAAPSNPETIAALKRIALGNPFRYRAESDIATKSALQLLRLAQEGNPDAFTALTDVYLDWRNRFYFRWSFQSNYVGLAADVRDFPAFRNLQQQAALYFDAAPEGALKSHLAVLMLLAPDYGPFSTGPNAAARFVQAQAALRPLLAQADFATDPMPIPGATLPQLALAVLRERQRQSLAVFRDSVERLRQEYATALANPLYRGPVEAQITGSPSQGQWLDGSYGRNGVSLAIERPLASLDQRNNEIHIRYGEDILAWAALTPNFANRTYVATALEAAATMLESGQGLAVAAFLDKIAGELRLKKNNTAGDEVAFLQFAIDQFEARALAYRAGSPMDAELAAARLRGVSRANSADEWIASISRDSLSQADLLLESAKVQRDMNNRSLVSTAIRYAEILFNKDFGNLQREFYGYFDAMGNPVGNIGYTDAQLQLINQLKQAVDGFNRLAELAAQRNETLNDAWDRRGSDAEIAAAVAKARTGHGALFFNITMHMSAALNSGSRAGFERGMVELNGKLREAGARDWASKLNEELLGKQRTAAGYFASRELTAQIASEEFKDKVKNILLRELPLLVLSAYVSTVTAGAASAFFVAAGWGSTAVRAAHVATTIAVMPWVDRTLRAATGERVDWSAEGIAKDYLISVGSLGAFKAIGATTRYFLRPVLQKYAGKSLDVINQTSCFVAGTPILTPDGDRPVESFQIGDRILSRSEFDCEAPLEVQVVDEIFTRTAPILTLTVAGHAIRTTAEHPFYVRNQGWRCAKELKPGDQLHSHDGRWIPLDAVSDLDGVATVYNLRVRELHTYFVGATDWGFSVWAHNANYQWWLHEGQVWMRNAETGVVSRSPYTSEAALRAGMGAEARLTELTGALPTTRATNPRFVQAEMQSAQEKVAAQGWQGNLQTARQSVTQGTEVAPGLFMYNPIPANSIPGYAQHHLWPRAMGGPEAGWVVYARQPHQQVLAIQGRLNNFLRQRTRLSQRELEAWGRTNPDELLPILRDFYRGEGVPFPY